MKWIPNNSYILIFLIFGLTAYQVWKGKGFIYKVMITSAKKKNQELSENDIRKQWLRALVVIFIVTVILNVAVKYFR